MSETNERKFVCLVCGGAVEEGFVLDRGHGDRKRPAEWIEGAPVPSFWTGTAVSNKIHRQMEAFRCKGCGYVMFFARNPV